MYKKVSLLFLFGLLLVGFGLDLTGNAVKVAPTLLGDDATTRKDLGLANERRTKKCHQEQKSEQYNNGIQVSMGAKKLQIIALK